MLALPVRYGGIGILNPVETANFEYETSLKITGNLTSIIYHQENTWDNYNEERVKNTINKTKQEKEKRLSQEFDLIKAQVNDEMKTNLDLAREKGSGSWLTALPIQALGYVLNRREFRDSLCLRYGWKIPNTTPFHCACGKKNDVDHALTCMKGGYVAMRHNRIRDLEASILKEVCKDVKVEPELLPIGNSSVTSSNEAERARCDVSGIGIWSPMERTFLDVRVFHPNSPCIASKRLKKFMNSMKTRKSRNIMIEFCRLKRPHSPPLCSLLRVEWLKNVQNFTKNWLSMYPIRPRRTTHM